MQLYPFFCYKEHLLDSLAVKILYSSIIETNPPKNRKQVIDMTILYVANGYGEMIDLSTLDLDPYDDDN
jgi:hypothetical protein